MKLKLVPLRDCNVSQFKKDMQDAFQQGALDGFGKTDVEILPESHISSSLLTKGAVAYEALLNEEMVGGAIVVIDNKTHHNHLDFLYVKNGVHGKGVGQFIWNALENLYPQTKVWETCTPYFEKRNIHFYINRCGFHIVEFFNEFHPDPNEIKQMDDSSVHKYFEGMFKFQKVMNR